MYSIPKCVSLADEMLPKNLAACVGSGWLFIVSVVAH